jgi:flagellin-like hook-associated protein FlgL
MSYHSAEVSANADTVTVNLYDGKYGNTYDGNTSRSVTYVFDNGAADGDTHLNQMIWNNSTGHEVLTHNITFGVIDETATFKYGERAGAGDYWGNTGGVESWYSHAYYGSDATYYFASGASGADVVKRATVNRQNDINASLLFEYDGNAFTVRAKGFDRTGGNALDDATQTLTAADMAAIASGGKVTIHGIEFSELAIALGGLRAGDKFVVNVAAAAMLDGLTSDVNNLDAFQSTANAAIKGDPFHSGASSSQYRLANGAEDGETLKLLGYFVDPINGSSDVPGVGYYEGNFEMTVSALGFEGGTVGVPDDLVDGSIVMASVNYQGNTKPIAGALVTSVYFGKMENGKYDAVKDFVRAVGYSDYIYGYRSDKTYGPMNEAGYEQYNPYNASLIFDVVDVTDNVITFRVQGRVIDLDGNQWYAEQEEFHLNGGQNTVRDSTVIPPIMPDEVGDPVVLFADASFGGLYFDEFTLGNYDLWTVGDRFTLSLAASGSGDPGIDEIDIFSDHRGTTMPHSFRFNEGVLDNSTVGLGIYQLANNIAKPDSDNFSKDQVMDGTLSLSFGEFHPGGDLVIKRAAQFEVAYQRGMDAGVAHYYSKLEDIGQFWDSNGVSALAGNGEVLTVRQGGREIKVRLGGGMELGKLAEYISDRIWLDLLMQYDGEFRGSGDADSPDYNPYLMDERDRHKIISLVNNAPGESANEAVTGTLLAHSVLTGAGGELKFYGSEQLMKALAFTTIQEASDALFRVSVSDAHSGRLVNGGTTSAAGSRVYGLISDSTALDLDGDIGLVHTRYDESRGTFVAEVDEQFIQYVHLADNSAVLQIGANEGESMILTLGAMTAKALGIDGLDVRNRESSARAITIVDNAIGRVSRHRAIIGSQIGRLEHTITNLNTASLNLTGSRSQITDADIASEMMEFTKLNILTQIGNSMMAQANMLPQNVLPLMR